MDITTGAMNTLLPKLVKLVVGEYKLHKGAKAEIEELEKEMQGINIALRKVSMVPPDQLDEQVKLWANDARELSYDIEDAVDTFMLRGKGHEPAEPFSFKGLTDRTTNLFKKAMTNHKIHNAVKDIIKQVKKVSERRDRYKVENVAPMSITETVDPRLEGMYRKATELVGIDGPKNELSKRLMNESSSSEQQPNIISIVGFGGLGKTTLANALYQDLKDKFDCHIFVSATLNPDIKKIFKNILFQLDNNKHHNIYETLQERQLINMIREFLDKRRCLCVIDDVWKESAWDAIKLALQVGNAGSKIIITTRSKTVAEHAGGDVYELKTLCDDDSRKLFYTRTFDSEEDCPVDLSEVTKKILKKCGGLPLAIITISSLLASRPRSVLEWEKVNQSMGSQLGKSLDVDKMRKILSLSYYDLPPHLKTCLLSLSKYPEDTVIRKDVLIWSWIAEGFITDGTQAGGENLREFGESCFSELVNRSLIQPVDIDHVFAQDGVVHACQVHDTVLELINHLSAEEGFITTLLSDGQQAGVSAPHKKKIRRLSLHGNNKSFALPEAREQLSTVRSLTVFGKVGSVPPLSTFRVLRVLQLEDCSGLDNNHLNGLGKLRYLRFLQLRGYNAAKLPESIGELESLETLDVRSFNGGFVSWVQLPMTFAKLHKLARLFADRATLSDGLALGDMKSLQELGCISFTPVAIQEIGNLKELRVLRIFFNDDMVGHDCNLLSEFIITCLQRCTNLQDLHIEANGSSEWRCSLDSVQQVPSCLQRFVMDLGVSMTAFPWWLNSRKLSCLTILSIRLRPKDLMSQHVEKLAELPFLRFLRLDTFEYSGYAQKLSIPSGACAFRRLRDFHFSAPEALPTFRPGAMPQLQRIVLSTIVPVTDLSDVGLENLRSLRHVIIHAVYGRRGKSGQEAEAAFRKALKDNPNHPSLQWLY